MTMDNHTATQHEFTRKCLRLFTEDIPPVKLQTLEEEISIFAEGIIHFGGYNLDTQLAALTAERDALREALRPFAEIGKLEFLDTDRTIPVHLNYCIAARRALEGGGK